MPNLLHEAHKSMCFPNETCYDGGSQGGSRDTLLFDGAAQGHIVGRPHQDHATKKTLWARGELHVGTQGCSLDTLC